MENSRNKWFGIVKWCDDDIAEKLRDMDIEPTPAHIATVRSLCEDNHYFTDAMIEAGWSAMEYLIEEAMESGKSVSKQIEEEKK
jgi:hypothetical protein